jgi:hypothetical protein
MDTPTLLDSNITTTNVAGTTVNTASVSPAANKQIFVHVNITTYSGTPPAVSITSPSLGLTWTARSNAVHSDITNAVHYVFSGIGASTSSGVIPIVVAAGNSVASFSYQVVEVGATGTATIVQQSTHEQGPSEAPTSTTITGLAAITGSNGVVYFASRAGGTGSPFAASGSGNVLLAQTGAADSGIASFYNLSGTTTPTYLLGDFTRNTGIAFEIGGSGGGGGGGSDGTIVIFFD